MTIVLLLGAQTVEANEDDRYVDATHHFSLSNPRFTPSDEMGVATVAVTFAAPATAGFAPNVNVVVHNLETTLDAYREIQRRELGAVGWQILEQSQQEIGGRPALRTRARGSVQGLEIDFLAVTLIKERKKAYVLTCTATTAQFPDFEAEFDRVVSSFTLEP